MIGFTLLLTFLLWLISFFEFDQLERFGEHPLSLPPVGYVLHVLYYPSWLLPLSAGFFGWRLLRSEEPSSVSVSRYCGYFVLATLIWIFVAVFGLYSTYAMRHHFL